MGWFAVWWRQPDHYDQLGSLLQARGMAGRTRAAIAVIGLALAAVILATSFSTTGPRGMFQQACALGAVGGATVGALLWVSRWPTHRQAVCFTLLSNASIALAALAQSNPLAGMLACTTFATMAGYIALFHAAPLMVYNFLVAASIGVVEAWRQMGVYGFVSAACAFSVVITLNLGVPFGIQAVAHVLGIDAMRAEHDQLTGLLNRRAFHLRAKRQLERQNPGCLVITVIDLDRFKQLNDRFGHSTGDDALVAVAQALREHTDDSAVIGRVGGEEFVIADVWHPAEVYARAQRLCDAIAALPFNITGSIGTAAAEVGRRVPAALDTPARLNELICAADAAMYVAKRRGGNQTCHHGDHLMDRRSDGVSASGPSA
ncbi:GGDEF domain-containing protein [Mycobacterium vicinigordonae]|uniref:Diguanylate cyclase n=1 Tax=Mycobacterium vicinigordonae TaxID=1719132 RepID=A0A7D6HUV9_9MYCO|nr:GGDEF domain-containing protein [Mycobacterium vicinigordonae]QLL07353.1 diguanylate cyclase [Mycobacterium vicinigordonae]